MDAFSQILSGVKLNGAVYFRAEFSAPWGITTPSSNAMTAKLALYQLVVEGAAVVELRLSPWGRASYE